MTFIEAYNIYKANNFESEPVDNLGSYLASLCYTDIYDNDGVLHNLNIDYDIADEKIIGTIDCAKHVCMIDFPLDKMIEWLGEWECEFDDFFSLCMDEIRKLPGFEDAE